MMDEAMTQQTGGALPKAGNAIHLAEQGPLDPDAAERLAAIFRALSDPTRVRIVSALSRCELCVGDLADTLGMTQSAVSHQLRTLREMRVVRHRRVGKQVYYTLDDEHIRDLYQRGLEHAGHG
jgi:DNA-binding transcriptional ArsR family regulator